MQRVLDDFWFSGDALLQRGRDEPFAVGFLQVTPLQPPMQQPALPGAAHDA